MLEPYVPAGIASDRSICLCDPLLTVQARGGGVHYLPKQPLGAVELDLALFQEPNRMEVAGIESAAAVHPTAYKNRLRGHGFRRQAEFPESLVNELPNVGR